LGAEKVAPQVGAVILLLGFYLTDFQLVCYVPKPAFSAMLVLACIDMTITWCYRSWFKVKDKSEWMVVPAIVVCAFVLDLLTAVFLGIAFSTFIFVASFFRSGVVKFVASGVTIQSTIERTFRCGEWLNQNGHLIQIVVLHNYLFFGNATTVYTYICHVFENAENNTDSNTSSEDRTPKFVVLDLALVTGMDTSTVDVFSDIKNLCASHKCKLFMAGMSPNLRSVLALGGIKPTTGVRSKRHLRFFASLDDALGKAEDMLLESDFHGIDTSAAMLNSTRRLMGADPGFRIAMRHIDEQVSTANKALVVRSVTWL
jgi:MFS superfamily sulfate permease-like transporter